ncbi:hypothetical protein IHE45_15G033500 [Dioscorea alata]|uniref:Uncharacterized protein n=1 Tax=Dioscorea alata TaxID=55571 RepID=A0ACB7UKP7_DIOAL|nr:hypothetical protein IHE45_15G033500 [Dioscorea alata]
MACFHISRSGISSPALLRLRPAPPRRRVSSLVLRSQLQDSDSETNGEEKPESLFMKELKRRGMTQRSLLEEREAEVEEEGGVGERGRGKRRNGVAEADFSKAVLNQREKSMALNSEGLEGLIPRAKLLLTIGGTFFLGFWPLILITVSSFAALYFYFGPNFVHDASKITATPPPYVDPYTLLEDERLSQVAPYVK